MNATKKIITTFIAITLVTATIGFASVMTNLAGAFAGKAEASVLFGQSERADEPMEGTDEYAQPVEDFVVNHAYDYIDELQVSQKIASTDFQNITVSGTKRSGSSVGLGTQSIDDSSILIIDGNIISYIDFFGATSAPKYGAGLWMGSDSTTDGSFGYFIGHNPGDFRQVMSLRGGDEVIVNDRDGNYRSYHVVDAFMVTNTTYWEDIESRVCSHGESIALQTCVGDNVHYRVVVAA